VQPDGKKLDYGELKQDQLETRGLKIVLAEEPTVVAGHAITSGHIPRITDFEMSPPAARLEAGATGSACESTFHFPPGAVKIEARPGDLGQIQKSTGIEKVHAVVGGWHLAPYSDEIIAKTVQALKEINPDYLIPMHCTGFRTMMATEREMPQKLILPSTGTRVVFGG
jgi:7,8-dihydropterin-6-yl-methyl-4-(beta-D-ribofuranosyl)aminobenzene 5'-phosphate synthase